MHEGSSAARGWRTFLRRVVSILAVGAAWFGPADAQESAAPDLRIIAARDTSILAGQESYVLRLVTNAPVHVRVTIDDGAAALPRELFSDAVTDVSEIRWTGVDEAGRPVHGAARLQFDVRAPDGSTTQLVLPLAIEAAGGDTLPLPGMPADTAKIWKQNSNLPSIASLAAGLLTGAAAIALPSVIALDGRGAPIRFAIGGTLGVTGVLGFFAQREQQLDAEAIQQNRMVKDAWQAAVDTTIEENRERRHVRLRITAGELVTGGIR